MQLPLFNDADEPCSFHVDAGELFEAYLACRRNKRNTRSALAFALDYEQNLLELKEEMESGSWQPGRSIAFVVKRPVLREVFAATFRDRVVHHWLMARLNPLFEDLFIDDSYACRVGKGTLYGVRRVASFMDQATCQYTQKAWVLRLDIEGFFMNINRRWLFDSLLRFLDGRYTRCDLPVVLDVLRKVVCANPAQNCIIKGNKRDWKNLPSSKSLFKSRPDCGLPIGNLSSQILANFYLHPLDACLSSLPGLQGYGRYVDDFVLVHTDHKFLERQIPFIRDYLQTELGLRLHPKKIYLQACAHGLKFLGNEIRPGRIVPGARVRGNFWDSMSMHNAVVRSGVPTKLQKKRFQNSMNSYLGLMKHYASFQFRRRLIRKNLSVYWLNHFYISGGYSRFVAVVRRAPKVR